MEEEEISALPSQVALTVKSCCNRSFTISPRRRCGGDDDDEDVLNAAAVTAEVEEEEEES